MKKILSLILVLAMTFSLSTTALAADSTTSSISENEAVELARWFIANDIYENGNNGWSESTVIDSVTTDSGFYGSSYIVNLSANGKNNGYIVLGTTVADVLIKEFSYSGKPLFVDLQPINGGTAAYHSDNSVFSVDIRMKICHFWRKFVILRRYLLPIITMDKLQILTSM